MIGVTLLTFACSLPVMSWIVSAVHECSHAVVGRASGLRLRQVRIGSRTSRPLVVRGLGVRWVLHASPFGGMAYFDAPTRHPWRWRKFALSVAGPIGTICALGLIGLFSRLSHWPDAVAGGLQASWITVLAYQIFMTVASIWQQPNGDLRQAALALTLSRAEIDERLRGNAVANRLLQAQEDWINGAATFDSLSATLDSLPVTDEASARAVRLSKAELTGNFDSWSSAAAALDSEGEPTGQDGIDLRAIRLRCHLLDCVQRGLEPNPQDTTDFQPSRSTLEADVLAAVTAFRGDLREVRRLHHIAVQQNDEWHTMAERWCWRAFALARANRQHQTARLLRRANRLLPHSPVVRMFSDRVGSLRLASCSTDC